MKNFMHSEIEPNFTENELKKRVGNKQNNLKIKFTPSMLDLGHCFQYCLPCKKKNLMQVLNRKSQQHKILNFLLLQKTFSFL